VTLETQESALAPELVTLVTHKRAKDLAPTLTTLTLVTISTLLMKKEGIRVF
jgi:hypothetical protein